MGEEGVVISIVEGTGEGFGFPLGGHTVYVVFRLRGKIDNNRARGKAPFERTDTTSCYSAPIAHVGFPAKVVLAADP